ncbi:nicotinate-nucleotide--dimethylbenzimidazole phosphoribosyltransferase [Streptomyces glomeratus]|uniref:Nicotinate-nucleotide--dimethylbenzimidazole phosphoribosyltransferase n=1 Tax=Streptomyces glomeratus TaxID=284452 RepID=A0ABN3Y9K7_9ACTN|nr:nicotinate-nucleotide--dimethylbenzimidazole phosphoribosyltransferase [Streptomyces glomeratus]MCF1510322.1 nicotinate-nucleotide--dimethylbenzimidazole phosphoribosyltransferase [Streptomyces glomeratus]
MTDTGQVPGEGLPESAGMVDQPGVLAPGAYTYLDPSDSAHEDDDLLLMPGQQGAWGTEMPQPAQAPEPYPHEPGAHETAGRDSGSIDLGAVRTPPPASVPQPAPARRPLHLGPPTPDATLSPVRSLSDRGPADAPMRPVGPPTTGPEYLDVTHLGDNSPQGAVPWGAPPQAGTPGPGGLEGSAAETVVPAAAPEPATVAEPAPFAPEPAPFAPRPVHRDPEGSGQFEVQPAAAGPEAFHTPGTQAPAAPADSASQHLAGLAQDIPGVPQDAPGLPQDAPGAPQGAQGLPQDTVGPPTAQPAAPHVPDAARFVPTPEGAPVLPDGPSAGAAPAPQDAPLPATPGTADGVTVPEASPAGEVPQAPDAASDAPLPHTASFTAVPNAPQPADEGAHAGVPEQATDTHATPATGLVVPPAQAPEPGVPVQAPHSQDPGQAVPAAPDHQPAEADPGTPAVDATDGAAPEAAAPLPEPAVEEAQPAVAEPGEAVPAAVAAEVAAPAAPAEQAPGERSVHAEPTAVAAESGADHSLGRFVPVEGTVPAGPYLAPTPPHALSVPPLPPEDRKTPEEPVPADAEQQQPAAAAAATEQPVVTVPAPREGEASTPEPRLAQPESVVAQQAEDLDTRAADQEESTAAVEDVRESTGPAAPGYDDAEREAVLRVMRERRDIRNGFRSDPIPHEVLLRVLEAAHTAPSVGHSQPWDFVVIRSAETRRTMHELAQRQREAYAKSLPKGRAKQFKELKIEAILDTPVNIVVTADPTRGGRHTLGRHTQPQMAPYSSALAVENLWLAARAEGLGVGWVSFFDEREMVRALGLPEHLEVVAYLCVGYVDEFPEEPELMQAGWSKRRPLSWVVHEETYGRRALPGEDPHDLLAETVAGIRPLDAKALGEAWERQKRMTKPAGALGMLEIISAQLSGLSRQCPPPVPEPAAVAIFAGDHGVHAQGVTPWPQEVTGQMVANFLGGGAVCNAFANQVGAEVCVVDVGVAADLPATPGLLPRKVRPGTADMTTGPALTREEVKQAIEVGIETARDLVAAGNKALLTGEMGIANTTASAALIAVFTDTDPSEVTGRGTGINDETLARKTEVVRRAIELHQPDPADPIGVLAAFGGLEHAALVGLLLGGASLRTPVILDGVSAGAAALVARAIAPEVLAACIAGHRSAEPGHVAALNKLGLRPLVDLDLRLGEGTGALLALPLVQSAARAMHEVATFDSAGVTEK